MWAVPSSLLCSTYAHEKFLFEQHPTFWSQVAFSEFTFYSRAQKLDKITHGYFEGKNQDSERDGALFKPQLSLFYFFFFHLGQVQKHHQVLCSDRAVGRPVQLLHSHSEQHGEDPTAVSQRDRGAALRPLSLTVWMPRSPVLTLNIPHGPSCSVWSFMVEEFHSASLIVSVRCLIR